METNTSATDIGFKPPTRSGLDWTITFASVIASAFSCALVGLFVVNPQGGEGFGFELIIYSLMVGAPMMIVACIATLVNSARRKAWLALTLTVLILLASGVCWYTASRYNGDAVWETAFLLPFLAPPAATLAYSIWRARPRLLAIINGVILLALLAAYVGLLLTPHEIFL